MTVRDRLEHFLLQPLRPQACEAVLDEAACEEPVCGGQGRLMRGGCVVEKADAALDGGSIFLIIRDHAGHQHGVELVQSMFLGSSDRAHLPGRLYFDGELVAVRSEQERVLLDGLREAIGASAPVPGAKEFVGELLRFVESERYVEQARTLVARADDG